ncbi:hypothetical protein [Ramlibacter montanisoli]|uniref:hypothetical protein n=1 Tax=Ramlibacter montanisoli TaxID=2732512 RepID=UPI00209C169A|nr:hypothetical protein [Ramlibacter montanisoli]
MAVVRGVAFTVSGVPAAGVVVATLTSAPVLPDGSVTTMKKGAVSPALSVQV